MKEEISPAGWLLGWKVTKRLQSASILKVLLAIAAAVCFNVGTRVDRGPIHKKLRTSASSAADKARTAYRRSAFPIMFESNVGQSAPQVRFLSHGKNSTLFISEDEAVLSMTAPRPAVKRQAISRSVKASPRSGGPEVLRIRFLGANSATRVEGSYRLRGRINYFIGKDPKRWHRNIPTWRAIVARDVWPSASVRYHGESGQLEFDIELKPGADASAVRLGIKGASSVRSTNDGDLMMRLKSSTVILRRPRIYQEANDRQIGVDGHFVIVPRRAARSRNDVEVGFSLAQYDHSLPLIIDPTLTYSTFLGGSGAPGGGVGDSVNAIAVDSAGNTYLGGLTGSLDFPTSSGSFQTFCPSTVFCYTGFVAKLDPSGSSLIYATFLGGSGNGFPNSFPNSEPVVGIAIDQAGDAYVSGDTNSIDFPTTPGALLRTGNGDVNSSAYLTKLSPDGSSLLYSTYIKVVTLTTIGGIAVDSAGDAYVTGQTVPPFPVTPNGSFNTTGSAGAFVTELDPTGSHVIFSALFESGIGQAISVQNNGYVYVAGIDPIGKIPTTSSALQRSCGGCTENNTEGFFMVLNPSAATPQDALVYSTYIGGALPGNSYFSPYYNYGGDSITGIAIDHFGRAYLAGTTGRTDFPVTSDAYQSSCQQSPACDNTFLAIIDPSQSGVNSLVYSTLFGGTAATLGNSVAVDGSGRAYIVGQAFAGSFPVTPDAIETSCPHCGKTPFGPSAVFFSVLNPFAQSPAGQLVFSTLLGGTGTTGNVKYEDAGKAIAIDPSGVAYVAGTTFSTDFPITSGAAETICLACQSGNNDGFVSKIDPSTGSLIYSTFIGGSGARTGGDGATGVALDHSGNIFVAGFSGSTDFPTTIGAFQRNCSPCVEYDSTVAFVTKLNPAATEQDQLIYSTYLGGTSQLGDAASDIAVDSAGEAYVAGIAESIDFPTTSNAYQPQCHACAIGGSAAFLTKLDSSGGNLVYSTYLGGATIAEALGIAVDHAGAAFLTGETFDSDFPITSGAAQPNCPACANFDPDTFLAKIDPALTASASLVYSTFLGGSGIPFSGPPEGDVAYRVAVNSLDQAVVAGTTHSSDYPVTSNAYMAKCPSAPSRQCGAVFIAVVDPSMTGPSGLRYSTFFGGTLADYGRAVAVDSLNRIYFVENSFSLNLPTSPGAYSPSCPEIYEGFECVSAFVGALDPSASPSAQLFYATYLGGTGLVPLDYPTAIAVDAGGNIYVAGYSYASGFPTTPDAVQSSCLACPLPGLVRADPFFSELNPAASGSGQLVYSTYLGGSGQSYDDEIFDYPTDIALDTAGHVVVVGSTFSHDFPITSNAFQSRCPGCQNVGGRNAFVADFSFPAPVGTLTPRPPVTPSPTPFTTPTETASITPTPTATMTPVESTLTVIPKSINFGRVPFATERGKQSVMLTNTKKSQTVMIEKVIVTAPFAVPPGACLGELAPGKSCKIPVRFTASGLATYEGSLTFTTNDQNPVPSVHLRGVGVKRK